MISPWFLLVIAAFCCNSASANNFTLTVLHTNDVHARIDEFDSKGTRCTPELSAAKKCYGGISRHRYFAEKVRSENPNTTIFLNAGDYFQGTIWYQQFKASVIGDVIELLHHDAITLGNHEFDDGSEGLFPLLRKAKEINTPILGCNVDFSKNDLLREYQPQPSIVIERAGVQIGIIGFLTPDTTFLSKVDGGTVITDEIECIRREAQNMTSRGIKFIIATGHSGYVKDMEIARVVPEVKMVVGGHSHTYLSCTSQTNGDSVKGPYPTVVTRDDKTKALVVQDFWMGKYMGYINVTFDTDSGNVLSSQGDGPWLLDHTVPKDNTVEEFLKSKRETIDEKGNAVVGSSKYLLSGDKEICRFEECALGNMLVDAYTKYFVTDYLKIKPTPSRWNYVDFAVTNGGSIRGSLPRGNITFADVVAISPFANNIWILPMNGTQVKKMIETGLHRFDVTRLQSYGGFLIYSGVRVVADITKPPYERVSSVQVLCGDCNEPRWDSLDANKTYKVAMNSYMASGGDKHDFKDVPMEYIEKTNMTDTDLLVWYLSNSSPVYPTTDERLKFITEKAADNCSKTNDASKLRSALFVFLAPIFALVWCH